MQQKLDDFEAQYRNGGKLPKNGNILKKVPENSTESVAGTPSNMELAHSKQIIQLRYDQRKRKSCTENLAIHNINENADPDLHTYLQ